MIKKSNFHARSIALSLGMNEMTNMRITTEVEPITTAVANLTTDVAGVHSEVDALSNDVAGISTSVDEVTNAVKEVKTKMAKKFSKFGSAIAKLFAKKRA